MIVAYTSHWRSPLLKDVDAVIVGVSRGTPRWSPGYRYTVMRSLAPSDEVWAHEDTQEFEAAYLDQLEALGTERVLADLRRIAGHRTAILLCWERPHEEYCHRWTLSRWLRDRAGLEVPELQPGDLPQHEGAAEPTLFGWEDA